MSVVIPDSLAGDVLRRIMRDLEREIRGNGGEVTAAARELLWALHYADQRHQQETRSSERTDSAEVGSVEIGTADAAARMGCSQEWVSRLVRSGRVRGRIVGRVLLVEAASLDEYRFGRTDGRRELAG